MHTEKEALEKVCHKAMGGQRSRGYLEDLCIGSKCMAWRWADKPTQVLSRHDKQRRGYCGLAGSAE